MVAAVYVGVCASQNSREDAAFQRGPKKIPVVGVGAEAAEAAKESEVVREVLPRLLRHEAVAHRDEVLEGLGHLEACKVGHELMGMNWCNR